MPSERAMHECESDPRDGAQLIRVQRRAGQHEQHDEEDLRGAAELDVDQPVLAVEVARANAEHEQRKQHGQPPLLCGADRCDDRCRR